MEIFEGAPVEILIGFFWFLGSVAVAEYAMHRGRSGVLWFFASLFFSPLVGFFLAICSTSAAPKVAARVSQTAASITPTAPSAPAEQLHVTGAFRCPWCNGPLEVGKGPVSIRAAHPGA